MIPEVLLTVLSDQDVRTVFMCGCLSTRVAIYDNINSKILIMLNFLPRLALYRRCLRHLHCQKSLMTVIKNEFKPSFNLECITFGDESPRASDNVLENVQVYEQFLNENEEKSLLSELEPYLKRLRYESDHWDDAIHGYRETEKANWNEDNKHIINKVQLLAFPKGVSPLKHVHVLDIKKDGYIKPHVDSVRFCGDTIAGLSLLSDSVMRLVREKGTTTVNVLLPRRSLYILRKSLRYEFTHEILEDKQSYFKEQHVPRDRRISVICRNEPA